MLNGNSVVLIVTFCNFGKWGKVYVSQIFDQSDYSAFHGKSLFSWKFAVNFTLESSLPSSGSSLAQVSAVMRLAMKRWLFWGLTQRWGATEEVMDMEELMWGHVMTELLEEDDEEDEEEDKDEEVGSRVVVRCSFSGSTSIESRRTWAVLRGWRSFCTATGRIHNLLSSSETF